MKCPKCNNRETKGNTGLCDTCRLKKWRKDNPDKVKDYHKKNLEKRNGQSRKWREDHPKYMSEYNEEYYKENKDKIKEYQKEYQNKYQKTVGNEKLKIRQEAYQNMRKIIIDDRKCCELCSGDKFLEIHHKNYESNDMDNLVLLCRLCHRKLHADKRKTATIKIANNLEESNE